MQICDMKTHDIEDTNFLIYKWWLLLQMIHVRRLNNNFLEMNSEIELWRELN